MTAGSLADVLEVLAGHRLAVLTGAGVSTDSGIPDYRGPDSPPRTPMTFQQFTGDEGFRRHYWARNHVGWRHVHRTMPNAGHRALAALEHRGVVTGLITQNVDLLHEAAGSRNVIDLHGRYDRVVCLSCGTVVGRDELAARLDALNPHFADFAEAYPDITLELVCDNRMIELVEGGFDAGIRLGESLAQDVVALPVGGPQRMVTLASPRYLAGRKLPKTPEDLREHQCLNYRLTTGSLYRWEYAQDGRVLDVEVAGPLISNDGDVLLAAARDGAGIMVAFEGMVRGDLESGRMVPLLEPWWPTFPGFYLYHPSRAQMPRKLRVFIDFLQARHAPPPVSQRAVKLASVPRSRPPSPARRVK